MNITPQAYSEMSRQAEPKSRAGVNTLTAFLVGGGICVIGQLIRNAFETAGFDTEKSALWTSVILVSLSAFFTGLGWYERLAKHAGAGTLVPITGFSNAISSSAIEAKSEGLVLGVGAKIFTIAGPVILYGCASAFVYGLIYYIFTRF
ncbi:MAG: stage V sporulation protein AC [Ruminococcus flavefaciens]|nr:stage V sporulation protein AC [Ruminococcus flavefaciens]MCM1229530.1 stage V sporulation protein AC [Ruminococcus flavefaciens]